MTTCMQARDSYCFLALAFPSGRALNHLLDSSFKSSFEEPIPPDHVRPSGETEDAEPVKGSQSDIDMAQAAAEAEVDVVVPKTWAPESPAFLEISEGDIHSTALAISGLVITEKWETGGRSYFKSSAAMLLGRQRVDSYLELGPGPTFVL
ncbi:unnamed protein product [Musa hybrid cultivar]